MASQSAALAPLGVSPPKRSTLAEANERRPAALDQSLLATLYARGQAVAPGHGFRFKNPLLSWDRPTLARCLNRFPGARVRTATGAIKVPTRLDHAGHLPAVVVMTAGKGSDIARARGLQLPKGSLVAMDRGDIDDGFLFRLTQDGVYVVTRQTVNAKCKGTARFAVNWLQGMTSDQNVVLHGKHGHAYPDALRRVGYRDPETGNPYVFWTTVLSIWPPPRWRPDRKHGGRSR
jgi:putative transposase